MNPLFHVYYFGYKVCSLELQPIEENAITTTTSPGKLVVQDVTKNMERIYMIFMTGIMNISGYDLHTIKNNIVDCDNLRYIFDQLDSSWQYVMVNTLPAGDRIPLPEGFLH